MSIVFLQYPKTTIPGVYEFNNDAILITQNNDPWLTFRKTPNLEDFVVPACNLLLMIDSKKSSNLYIQTENLGHINLKIIGQHLPMLNITMLNSKNSESLALAQPNLYLSLTEKTTVGSIKVHATWSNIQIIETQFNSINVLSEKGWADVEMISDFSDSGINKGLPPVILKTNSLQHSEVCLKSPYLNIAETNTTATRQSQEYHFFPSTPNDVNNVMRNQETTCAAQGETCECLGTVLFKSAHVAVNNTFFLNNNLNPTLCNHSVVPTGGSCSCYSFSQQWKKKIVAINIDFTGHGTVYFRHGIEPILIESNKESTMNYLLKNTISSTNINLTSADFSRRMELLNTKHPM